MTIPARDDAMTADGLARLTSMFAKTVTVTGLVKSYVNRVQELEDALWTVLNGRSLGTVVGGITLDVLGQLVGEPRNGRSDGWYTVALRLRILTNRSVGSTTSVFALLDAAEPGAKWTFDEAYPAAFSVVWFGSLDAYNALIEFLPQTRAGGVACAITWSPAIPSLTLTPADAISGTLGVGPSDVISGLPATTIASVAIV